MRHLLLEGWSKNRYYYHMIGQAKKGRKEEICVAGIDPSLRGTAICVIQGNIVTPHFLPERKRVGADRLLSIRTRVFEILGNYTISLTVLEGYSYGSDGRVFELGELGGVLKTELFLRGIPSLSVPPSSLKKFVTGSGDASKDKVIKAVREKYNLETKNDNIADAVALAKLGEVYLTEESTFRSELEVVKMLKEEKAKHGNQYRKLTQLSF